MIIVYLAAGVRMKRARQTMASGSGTEEDAKGCRWSLSIADKFPPFLLLPKGDSPVRSVDGQAKRVIYEMSNTPALESTRTLVFSGQFGDYSALDIGQARKTFGR